MLTIQQMKQRCDYCCWPKSCLLREQKKNPFSNIIAHSFENASSENATCDEKNQLSLF